MANSARDKSNGKIVSPYPGDTDDRRYCPECKEWLPFSEFYPDARTKDGLTRRCKQHHARKSYDSRKLNPNHETRDKRYQYNRNRLLSKYGMTQEMFDDMLAAQGGACAICKRTEPIGNGWVIDHDHSCCDTSTRKTCGSCVRGILCTNCNTALGKFQDDRQILVSAVRYLGGANCCEGEPCQTR